MKKKITWLYWRSRLRWELGRFVVAVVFSCLMYLMTGTLVGSWNPKHHVVVKLGSRVISDFYTTNPYYVTVDNQAGLDYKLENGGQRYKTNRYW